VKSFLKFQNTLKLGFPVGLSWENPLIENTINSNNNILFILSIIL
jgi:hypothetical protein